MKRPQPPAVLTVKQFAKLMQVHPFTVTRLARARKLKGAFKIGGVWRFPTREVLEWMRAGGDVSARLDGRRGKRKQRRT